MRIVVLAIAAVALCAPALAEEATPKLYASPAEIAAMTAAKKGGMLVSLAPYRASLEVRTGPQPGSVHAGDAELFYIVDGSGVLVTGGTLNDKKDVVGGSSQKVEKGAVVMVPEKTPHQFVGIEGTLVDISFHVPRPLAEGVAKTGQ